MIDWNGIDKTKPADWIRLSESLMQKAMAAVQASDKAALQGMQADLKELALAATLACPPDVLGAINSSSRQVAAALLAIDLTNLAERSARLDAAGAKIAVAANAAKAEASRLRLEAARRVIDELNGISLEVRQLRDQLGDIPKKDIPAKLDAVLDLLVKLEQRARAVIHPA